MATKSMTMEWTCKREPQSPASSEDSSSWLGVDFLAAGDEDLPPTASSPFDINIKDEEAFITLYAEESSTQTTTVKYLDEIDSLENLPHLDDLEDWIKAEPLSVWLEEKIEIPLYEVRQPTKDDDFIIHHHQHHQHHQTVVPVVPDTSSLLQEFETVLGAVELNHGQLTPPQSPVLASLHPAVVEVYHHHQQQQQQQQQPAPEDVTVAEELAAVDELVRTRAEDLGWSTSPSYSPSSSGEECSSDDPDWIPDPVYDHVDGPFEDDGQLQPETSTSSKAGRRRAKPYSRSLAPEDKKSRKKEQNKNAATRYRQKKKAEVDELLGEERAMQNRNDELQGQANDLQREIKYLKGLMRDLFKAKGLIQ